MRKVPFALRHYPSALVAVFVAALLVVLASSSSPFVTTAAASEALKNKLADLTPLAAGLQITGAATTFGRSPAQVVKEADARDAAIRQLARRLPYVGAPVLTLESQQVYVSGPAGDTAVKLMARTGFRAHIHVLAKAAGDGIWISNITAHAAGVRAGGKLTITIFGGPAGFRYLGRARKVRLRVAGVYRALAQSPAAAYWGNLFQDIYPQTLDASPPPSYLFVTRNEALKLAGLVGGGGAETMAELPIDPKGITLAAARSLDTRFASIRRALPTSSLGQLLGCRYFQPRGCRVYSSLSSAVILADRNASAVSPAVTLLSDVGGAIALAVAAAAGAFLVRRRRSEAALLYARGAHPAAFAARTATEALGPTVAGGTAGFALAYGLTSLFAPSGSLDSHTLWSAAAHGAVALAIGLVLLVAAATFAFLHLYDTGVRGRLRVLRFVPWELPVLGVAFYLLVEIRSGGGLSKGLSHHPTLAVFVFPLLLVAGAAGLAARLGRDLLRFGRAASASVAVYLALRRLAAARGLLVVLAVVSAVALGACLYAEALATSLRHTTVEKAYIATGSDAQVTTGENVVLPRGLPFPIAKVEYGNQVATLGGDLGTQSDILVADPTALAQTLHWESDWGTSPTRFLDEIAHSPSWPLPVIVTTDVPASTPSIDLQGVRLPIRIVGRVQAFPLRSVGVPLVVTSSRALQADAKRTQLFNPLGVPWTYVLGKGPPERVMHALVSSPGLGAYYPASIETFLRNPDVLLATRTFSFMRTIAIAAAVLVLIGVLLYLQARQRSQVIASTLTHRMGLSRAAEIASLSLELGAILLFAAVLGGGIALAAAVPVVHHVDPLPESSPAPIFALPTFAIEALAIGLLLLTAIAGVATSSLARRADVSEALRVA